MENQKSEKINKVGLIAIIVLLICVLAIIIAIVSKNNKKEEKKTEEPTTKVVDTTDETAIVYDAKYKEEATVLSESYTDIYNSKYEYDITVPYVNIDGVDNTSVNNEIKALYDKFLNTYNECVTLVQNTQSTVVDAKNTCNVKVSYGYSIYENILSVMITYEYYDDLDVYNSMYYTFNVDTTTGKKLSYSDIIASHNYTRDDVANKIMENYKTFASSLNYTEEDYNKTLEAAKKDQIVMLTSDGKLSLIYKAYVSGDGSQKIATMDYEDNNHGYKPVLSLD